MKLFLQIEIGHWQGGYNNMLSYASSLSNDIIGTDLDSQSEPVIADLVLKLIDQAKQVFLFVQARDSNFQLGTSQRVFQYLTTVQEKIQMVVLCGDHRTVEQMLRPVGAPFVKELDPEKIRKLIQEFGEG
jgi:hypothetical protein